MDGPGDMADVPDLTSADGCLAETSTTEDLPSKTDSESNQTGPEPEAEATQLEELSKVGCASVSEVDQGPPQPSKVLGLRICKVELEVIDPLINLHTPKIPDQDEREQDDMSAGEKGGAEPLSIPVGMDLSVTIDDAASPSKTAVSPAAGQDISTPDHEADEKFVVQLQEQHDESPGPVGEPEGLELGCTSEETSSEQVQLNSSDVQLDADEVLQEPSQSKSDASSSPESKDKRDMDHAMVDVPEPEEKPSTSNTPETVKKRRGRKRKEDDILYKNEKQCGQIMQFLKSQREEGRFCDVVLHVQGCQYWAHRCVLSANTPYFDCDLQGSHYQTTGVVDQISLPCENRSAMEAVLDYMYTGQLNVSMATIKELLALADKLSLHDVRRWCSTHLCRNMNISNWNTIRKLVKAFALDTVEGQLSLFLLTNLSALSEFHNEEILELSKKELITIFQDYSSERVSYIEHQKFVFLLQWVLHNLEERLDDYESLLNEITASSLDEALLNETLKNPKYIDTILTSHLATIEFVGKIKKEVLEKEIVDKQTRAQRARKAGAMPLIEFMEDSEDTVSDVLDEDYQPESPLPVVYEEVPVKRKRGRPPKKKTQLKIKLVAVKSKKPIPETQGSETESTEFKKEEPVEEKLIAPQSIRGQSLLNFKAKSRRKATVPIRRGGVPNKLRREKPIHRCQYSGCDYVATRLGMLRDHHNSHEGVRTHACPVCNKMFMTSKHMHRHKKIHLGAKPSQCQHCPFATHRNDKLKDHTMRRHPEVALDKGWITTEQFEATKIPKVRTPRAPRAPGVRKKKEQSEQQEYTCEKCPKIFSNKNLLMRHMRGHGRTLPFLCEICGFSTIHFRSITLHKRRHNGNMFTCTYEGCTFSTIFKDRFRDHINKHEGIKNHVCSICGKAFAARKHMQRHEKSHVEIKPFGCNECEYRSTRRDKLNEHIRKHHPWNAVALGLMNAEVLENPQALALPKVRKPKKKKVPTATLR